MTEDETIRYAKLILKDLRLRGLRPSGGILEEWMAHYVAEAITRMEQGDGSRALSDQCAAVIARLWELRDAGKQRDLSSAVSSYLRRSTPLDDDAVRGLRDDIELATRDQYNAALFDAESGVVLAQIGRLEEQALSVLWAATRHAQRTVRTNELATGPANDSIVIDVYEVVEKPFLRSAQTELAKVFPEFQDFALDDYEVVSQTVKKVLRALNVVRIGILNAATAAEPSLCPDSRLGGGDLTPDDDVFTDDDDREQEMGTAGGDER